MTQGRRTNPRSRPSWAGPTPRISAWSSRPATPRPGPGGSDQLRHVWNDARFESEVNVVRANTSDDRFFMVAPGLEFPVGGAPVNPATSLVTPEPMLDIASTSFAAATNGTSLRDSSGTRAGAGTATTMPASRTGTSRMPVSGTSGSTMSGDASPPATASATPIARRNARFEKDRRFTGARLGWDYMERFNAGTTFDNRFETNVNLSDSGDYSLNTTSALTVAMASRVSLKVSLQWLYQRAGARVRT